jgi:hypothetical protein
MGYMRGVVRHMVKGSRSPWFEFFETAGFKKLVSEEVHG